MALPINPYKGQVHTEHGHTFYFNGITWTSGWSLEDITNQGVIAAEEVPPNSEGTEGDIWTSLKATTYPKIMQYANGSWDWRQGQPYYFLSASENIVEGNNLTITLSTISVGEHETVPYTITGVSSADINDAPLTGELVVDGNGHAYITFTPTIDGINEPGEVLTFTLDGIGLSISINMQDGESYVMTPSAASVNEVTGFSIQLTTTGVPEGTVLPYTITGVSSADISDASLTGSFVVDGSGYALQTFLPVFDEIVEGDEVFTITLDNITPTISTSVTIVDIEDLILRAHNVDATANGAALEPLVKDMVSDYHGFTLPGTNYQGSMIPGDGGTVGGYTSRWLDWGDDTLDGWGYPYLMDAADRTNTGVHLYDIPADQQNLGSEVYNTFSVSAFGKTFNIKHGFISLGFYFWEVTCTDPDFEFYTGFSGQLGAATQTEYHTNETFAASWGTLYGASIYTSTGHLKFTTWAVPYDPALNYAGAVKHGRVVGQPYSYVVYNTVPMKRGITFYICKKNLQTYYINNDIQIG